MKNNKFKGRTFCIGDIHGGLRALQQILDISPINSSVDELILLGDYVDGWSQSAETIDYLIELKKVFKNRIIFIKGNHDVWCEDWLLTGVKHPIWLPQGGQATVDSYIKTGHIVKDSHKDFFRGLHNYYIDKKNRGFVHGGFTSKKGLGYDVHKANYYWDRDMWGLALMVHGREKDFNGIKNYKRFEKHKEVFIGHTSTCAFKCKPHYPEFKNSNQPTQNGPIMVPMNRCNVWNLDTGGGWYGKLTIMDIDSKEYWQSDLVKDLYPEEKGR